MRGDRFEANAAAGVLSARISAAGPGPSRVLQWVLSGGRYSVSFAAGPGGSAAGPEAGLVADEDFAWAECVSIRAAGRRVGDPLPGLRLYQLAQHDQQPRYPVWPGSTANNTGTRLGTCGI